MSQSASEEPRKLTRAEAGRKGGQVTARRYGTEYYSQIGKEGGSKGGRTTLERHGPEHFSRIGRIGGRAPREPK